MSSSLRRSQPKRTYNDLLTAHQSRQLRNNTLRTETLTSGMQHTGISRYLTHVTVSPISKNKAGETEVSPLIITLSHPLVVFVLPVPNLRFC